MASAEQDVPVDRLLRLYAAARAIHRELLTPPDEATLFERACRIAVEVGPFRFAWLGVLNPTSGNIEPVAQCGDGEGYLDEIGIALDGSARSRGPTGSAIREGRHVLCQDIVTDPRMAPWRDAALERGFRSSGAFPIARGGAPFGALNVYAPEPGFMDSREAELLLGITENIGFALDLLDRERERADSEARLRASEERYRSLVERAGDGIFLASADLRYEDVNPAGCAMLGYRRDELVGKRLVDFVEPSNLAEQPMALARLVPGVPFYTERRLVRKDGRVIDVEIHGIMLQDGRLESITRDVTERKRLDAERAATERMASLGRLAQGVGHEINNPLAYVTLNLELAVARLSESDLPPEARGELERALSAAKDGTARIAHIVRALSAFGRGDAETTGPTDLNRVISSAITLTTNRLKHICQVDLALSPGLSVHANEFRLGQVFVNLLLNAADAMENVPGKRHVVTISARRAETDRIVVEVSDTGTGIDASTLGSIFEPFFTTKPVGRGTGIGLSISHSIVTGFGGTLEAENLPRGGARFRVTLQAARSASELANAPSSSDSAEEALDVLVIDDEPAVGRVVALTLREHRVTVVASAEAALELCATRDFDCILCDLMLPHRGGDAFHAALSQMKPVLVPRVVLMTGGAFTPAAQDFLRRVDNRRIDKPFSARALREIVREAARS